MKIRELLFTFASLFLAHCAFAQCAYYNSSGYIWVPNLIACVESVTVSSWDGCKGTATVAVSNFRYDAIPVDPLRDWQSAPPALYLGAGGVFYAPDGAEGIVGPVPGMPPNLGDGYIRILAPTNSAAVPISADVPPELAGIPTSVTIAGGITSPWFPAPGGSSVSANLVVNCGKPVRKCTPTGPCDCGGSSTTCGQPISLASGNTYFSQTDVKTLPGTGPSISLRRTWNSLAPTDEPNLLPGLFGPHWKSTYEEQVHLASDGMFEYSAADGSFTYFAMSGSVWTAAVPLSPSTILTPGTNQWTLTFPSGETRYFDMSSGHLTEIKDRNGRTTQLAYDGPGRIVSVTDWGGRHLYFAYQNPSSWLVSAVSSDFGIGLSYSYDNQGRLLQVVNPDQSTVNFEYNDPGHSYLVTAVKDSQGKVLESHTYDSTGRGLSSSRANGVEAVTVSYSN